MQTAKAIQIVRETGKSSELFFLDVLHENSGSSIYALSKELNWTYGKTQQVVQRLFKKGIIRQKQEIRNNRVQNLIFEVSAAELIDLDFETVSRIKNFLDKK